MRHRPIIALPVTLLLIACGAPARSVSPGSGNDAGAAPAPAPAPVRITLSDRRVVTLTGFRIVENRGLSAGQCGVTIDRQRLMTMGVDDTDAYSCDALVAAGKLPPDGRRPRIGLIYDVSSPNAHFRTAVVLREDQGRWQVDPAYAGRFDDTPEGRSIPALRRALRSGGD